MYPQLSSLRHTLIVTNIIYNLLFYPLIKGVVIGELLINAQNNSSVRNS